MEKYISVIIPNYNRGTTIGKCLEAAFSSHYKNFEVVVVDDYSTDDSVEIVKRFPCRLIQLNEHSGASKARNAGANNSRGEILFFIDSDCLIQRDTLAAVNKAVAMYDSDHTIIGGTYTMLPFDNSFFSVFQSAFVHYFETKRRRPDYIAGHAMAISARSFSDSGGFQEQFLPMLEDVELSHRLRRDGYQLVMDQKILVQHIFNFSLLKSLRNALRKSMYWMMYSMGNGDVLADSGTASAELKVNGASYLVSIIVALASLASANLAFLLLIPAIFIANLVINRGLLMAFYSAKGVSLAVLATLYYTLLYPAAIWAGTIAGVVNYLRNPRTVNSLRYSKAQRNYS